MLADIIFVLMIFWFIVAGVVIIMAIDFFIFAFTRRSPLLFIEKILFDKLNRRN